MPSVVRYYKWRRPQLITITIIDVNKRITSQEKLRHLCKISLQNLSINCSTLKNKQLKMSNDDSDSSGVARKKTKVRKSSKSAAPQKFREAWLSQSDFKYWLERVPNDNLKAKCKFCNVQFTADLWVLKKHLSSQRHNTTVKATITEIVNQSTEAIRVLQSVKSAEIRIVGFFVEHNISLSSSSHLIDIIKTCLYDSKIAQQISLSPCKARGIISNVIGASAKDRLQQKLLCNKFSVLCYQLPEIFTCIMVKFFDDSCGRVVTKFWEICRVDNEGAEHVYDTIISTFDRHSIPRSNMIGIASDGDDLLTNTCVLSRMKKDYPGISISRCISQSLMLCASQACTSLPDPAEGLAHGVYSFISNTCQSVPELRKFQFPDPHPQKLLRPGQNLLSLEQVVEDLLEHWTLLKVHYEEQLQMERWIVVETIVQGLTNPFTKLYYRFLKWILPKFTAADQYFQSRDFVVTEVYDVVKDLYVGLLGLYMNEGYLWTPLPEIDPENKSQFKPISELHFGDDVMDELENSVLPKIEDSSDSVELFLYTCRSFLVQSAVEIRGKFEFDGVLQNLGILEPKRALDLGERQGVNSLVPMFLLQPRVCSEEDYEAMDEQWRQLATQTFEEEMESLEIDVFWGKLLNFSDDAGEYPFEKLARCVLGILSYPQSNAQSEMLFSKVKAAKTKTLSGLTGGHMNGILLSCQEVEDGGGCPNFQPTQDMISRMMKDSAYSLVETSRTAGSSEDEDEDIIFRKFHC